MKIKDINIKDTLQELYFDWVNKFITLDKFAEHYGLDSETASKLIEIGREIYLKKVIKEKNEIQF